MSNQSVRFQRVQRGSVVGEILAIFTEKFSLGQLKPGDKLPSEAQLMQQMGVGRTALREAVRMMTAFGVIEVRQGDGMYVSREPSASILNPLVVALVSQMGARNDLLELRKMLEIGYCLLAAENASEEDFRKIEAAAAKFEELPLTEETVDTVTQADLNFHYELIAATHNPLIYKICVTMEDLFFTSIRDTLRKSEGRKWGIEGHRQIVRAIRENDPEKIRQAVLNSLKRWSLDLQKGGNHPREEVQSSPVIQAQLIKPNQFQ